MSNRDHVFTLGFDATEAIRGVEKFEKRLAKLNGNLGILGPNNPFSPNPSKPRQNNNSGGVSPDAQFRLEKSLDRYQKKLEATWGAGTKEAQAYSATLQRIKTDTKAATTNTGLRKLSEEFKDLRQNSMLAHQDIRKMNAGLKQNSFVANSVGNSMKNLARSYLSVFAVIEGGRALFKAGKDFDSLRASMLAASKNAVEAKANFQFVKEESQRLGVDVIAAGNGFNKIGASAKQAGMTTEQTKEIFMAASEASRTFGLNAERTNLVFLAFSQILSKGKVSQEELRRQLGEQLPGVMNIAAKAMNVTTGELEDLIKKGIKAEDFMPKFAKAMREYVNENGALAAAMQKVEARQTRMTNSFKNFSDAVFTSGAANILGSLFDTAATAVNGLTASLNALGSAFSLVDNFVNTVFNITVDETNTGFSILKNTIVGFIGLIVGKYLWGIGLAAIGTDAAAAAAGRWATALLMVKAALRSLMFATGIGAALTIGGWALEKMFASSSNKGGYNPNTPVSTSQTSNQVTIGTVVTNDPLAFSAGLGDIMATGVGTTSGAAGL